MRASYFVKLEFSVKESMVKTIVRELTMPVEILKPQNTKHIQSSSKQPQVLVYPKARLAPAEFKPRLLPGAHYKISPPAETEIRLSLNKLPATVNVSQKDPQQEGAPIEDPADDAQKQNLIMVKAKK